MPIPCRERKYQVSIKHWYLSNEQDWLKSQDSKILTLTAFSSSKFIQSKGASEDFLMTVLKTSCFWGNMKYITLLVKYLKQNHNSC
jgi:hypothetical protein